LDAHGSDRGKNNPGPVRPIKHDALLGCHIEEEMGEISKKSCNGVGQWPDSVVGVKQANGINGKSNEEASEKTMGKGPVAECAVERTGSEKENSANEGPGVVEVREQGKDDRDKKELGVEGVDRVQEGNERNDSDRGGDVGGGGHAWSLLGLRVSRKRNIKKNPIKALVIM
jgi:hypothetical protein